MSKFKVGDMVQFINGRADDNKHCAATFTDGREYSVYKAWDINVELVSDDGDTKLCGIMT